MLLIKITGWRDGVTVVRMTEAASTALSRGYYDHSSRHTGGVLVVAGWSYQWISHLSFTRDSADSARGCGAHPPHHRREDSCGHTAGDCLRREPL